MQQLFALLKDANLHGCFCLCFPLCFPLDQGNAQTPASLSMHAAPCAPKPHIAAENLQRYDLICICQNHCVVHGSRL